MCKQTLAFLLHTPYVTKDAADSPKPTQSWCTCPKLVYLPALWHVTTSFLTVPFSPLLPFRQGGLAFYIACPSEESFLPIDGPCASRALK